MLRAGGRGPHRCLAACLTIVRAYLVAGSPSPLAPLASFRARSDRVRSALVWLGCTDPCESVEAARQDDPEATDLRELLGEWERGLGLGERYTARALAEAAEVKAFDPEFGHPTAAYRVPGLRDVLLRVAGQRGDVSTKRLEEWFLRSEGRIVGGLRLTRDAVRAHGNVAQWVVRRV